MDVVSEEDDAGEEGEEFVVLDALESFTYALISRACSPVLV